MKKEKGQIFTDKWLVSLMLDRIDYKGSHILYKKIMEPSCGNGAFLIEIVERYILAAKKNNWNLEKIKRGLEENIHGLEKDKKYFCECLIGLDAVSHKYGINNVRWNVENLDSLKVKKYKSKMDIVIGNPPYVRFRNLDNSIRVILKNEFAFCKEGLVDLYVAFYEIGLDMLKSDGLLSYITPDNLMKNKSVSLLREHIREDDLLSELIDFGTFKVFKESLFTAILTLKKGQKDSEFNYYRYTDKEISFVEKINLSLFKGKQWLFVDNKNQKFIESVSGVGCIGNKVNVQHSLCTSIDKIYITNNIVDIDEKYCCFNGHKMEKGILRPVIKISKYDGSNVTRKILSKNNKKAPTSKQSEGGG